MRGFWCLSVGNRFAAHGLARRRHRRSVAVGLAATGAGAQTSSATRGHRQTGEARLHLLRRPAWRAPTFKNAGKACQARVDAQNAKGGVNGRKIDLEIIDDQSSGANLTAAQDLVQNRNVFVVVNNSSFAFLSYRYLGPGCR